MVQGPPLAEKFTKRGYSFSGPGTGPLDPLRVRLVFKGLTVYVLGFYLPKLHHLFWLVSEAL